MTKHNPDDQIWNELIDGLKNAHENSNNNQDKGAIYVAAEIIDTLQMTTTGKRRCKVGSTIE